MSITKKDIHKLAALSRLRLTGAEEEEAHQSLNAVLAMIDELRQADVDGVDEMAYVHLHGRTLRCRAPTPQPGIAREALLENAPESDQGYFLTPKVIE